MMRSLYSGVSGLRNHQTRMDVIGNNIANVNTVGFKASRTIFQDMYSQNMRSASSPSSNGSTGGTNPQQIGLGMTLSTIDTLFTRSAAQVTGATYDLMIQNDGFFVVRSGSEEYYTRAGNFYEDKEHFLVTAPGSYVMGYQANVTQGTPPKASKPTTVITTDYSGVLTAATKPSINTNSSPLNITAPVFANVGTLQNGHSFRINVLNDTPGAMQIEIEELDAAGIALVPPQVSAPININDPGGGTQAITAFNGFSFTLADNFDIAVMDGATVKLGTDGTDDIGGGTAILTAISLDRGATNNKYTYEIILKDAANREVQLVGRDQDGNLVSSRNVILPPPDPANTQVVTMGDLEVTLLANYNIYDLAGVKIQTDISGSNATGWGEPESFVTKQMDRIYIDENLYNVSVDKNGNITALVRKDGVIIDPATGAQINVVADQRVTVGRVVVAIFDNQQALEKVGSNLYRTTANTGEAKYRNPGEDGAGSINPNSLEMSNVDLAQEFTDMIVTQRGFQANSRIITVSDTLLEELINLKR